MPLVCFALPLARDRERLAGTASSPNRAVCWPSCEFERVLPSPDACEEPNVSIFGDVLGAEVFDALLIDGGSRVEIPQPLGCMGIVLVEPCHFGRQIMYSPQSGQRSWRWERIIVVVLLPSHGMGCSSR